MCEVNIGDYLWLSLYGEKGQIVCGYLVDTTPNQKLIALSPFSVDEYLRQNKLVNHTWVNVSLVSLIDMKKYEPETKQIGFKA